VTGAWAGYGMAGAAHGMAGFAGRCRLVGQAFGVLLLPGFGVGSSGHPTSNLYVRLRRHNSLSLSRSGKIQ